MEAEVKDDNGLFSLSKITIALLVSIKWVRKLMAPIVE
jgi:hypothetical protein